MPNYKMNGYDYRYGQGRNDFGYASQNSDWESQNSNYGWNYYPETENGFNSYEDDSRKEGYDFKQNFGCGKENEKHDCKTVGCNRNCFRPCFSFPCFRRNIDCRKTRPCYDFDRCRDDWKDNRPCQCPCHDYDDGYNKKPEHDRHECEKNNRFYFSGCIEFKNFDRKF